MTAQELMPYLYPVLALTQYYIAWLFYRLWRLNRSPLPGSLATLTLFEAMGMSSLAVLTGPYALLDIAQYRPVIVLLRGMSVPTAIVVAILLHTYLARQIRLFDLD